MDSNDLNYKLDNDRTYRATSNLNTVIDNPHVNMNNAMGMNIQEMDNEVSNSYRDVTNVNINQNNDFNKDNVSSEETNINSDKTSKVSYQPTLEQKKKPRSGIVVSKEVKAMAVIIFILLLVVFVIPYIYDFFKEMDLVITG